MVEGDQADRDYARDDGVVIFGNEIVKFCVITAINTAAAFFFFRKFFGRV